LLGVAEGSEYLAGNAKIRVIHVGLFGGFREAESEAAKVERGHSGCSRESSELSHHDRAREEKP
jgi:hypothetical protein